MEEEIRRSVHEAAPKSAKVTSVMCEEVVEKMEKWSNLWVHVLMTD